MDETEGESSEMDLPKGDSRETQGGELRTTQDAGQGADDEENDDNDEGEEEVLLEPRFKYSRILNNTPAIFAKETACCIAVHDKFIAIGTQTGYIYILDHLGNLHPESTARHHRCAVLCISVDTPGGHFASCAQDARISIYGIGTSELTQTVDLKVAARSVAICPDFSRRGSGHPFVTGEANLTLHERTFFSGHKATILFQGLERDGFITQISWHQCYIAFSNTTGTRIYDRQSERIVALIQPFHDVKDARFSRAVASHCWINDETLAVACANCVSVCVFVPSSEPPSSGASSTLVRKVEVHYSWKVEMYISDISFTPREKLPNSWQEIVVFGINISGDSKEGKSSTARVQLALLEPESVNCYVLTTEDRIEMRGCARVEPYQLHMRALPLESLYFLLGPKEFIEARPCSADDRVRWYLENGMLKDAMDFANEHATSLEQLSALDVGKQYIDTLIKEGKFSQAAACLTTVCGKHKDLWEYYVNEFEQRNVVLQLARYLPAKEPQLEPECYQSVLTAALYNQPLLFRNLVKLWSPDLYRVGAIIDMAMRRVMREDSSRPLTDTDRLAIYRSLASLFTYERKYAKAVMLYISMKDKSVFQLIERYRLFDLVKEDISKLMLIDANLAIRLVIENGSSLPAKTVLTQISKFPKLQLLYLNRLFERHEGDEFADLAVRLYADFEPRRLLPFLRKNESYDISKALAVCEKKQLINEMVFLLGRSGNVRRALNLLVDKLDRIDLAIDFCRETDDADLWEALVDASMHKPSRISQLLNSGGNYLDPMNVIQKIPPRLPIPGLRDSLTKILRDYELQVKVQDGCTIVTKDDCDTLFNRFLAACNRPILVDAYSLCLLCRELVMHSGGTHSDAQMLEDVIAFGCGHVLHVPCVESARAGAAEADLSGTAGRKRSVRGDDGECPVCSEKVLTTPIGIVTDNDE